MKIEERLIRREREDIIEIGNILEKFWRGTPGLVVLSIINGLIFEATRSKNDQEVNGDIRFGQIKALEDLKERIEQAIYEKNMLEKPIEDDSFTEN